VESQDAKKKVQLKTGTWLVLAASTGMFHGEDLHRQASAATPILSAVARCATLVVSASDPNSFRL